MIDWNDNAKAAAREFAEYIGQTKHCERYLERIVPTQQKTAADNVIHKDGYGTHFVGKKKTVADAVEQEGEKWTHTYSDYGVIKDCILVHDKPDEYGQVLVLNRRGEYVLTDNVKLKPIKPTLTKSQAWDKISSALEPGSTYDAVVAAYEII